jgi:regulator of replication initiation timing
MLPSTLLRPGAVSRQTRPILGPTASEAVSSAEAASLQAENTSLREENAALRRELANLRQQVGYWQAMHRRATQKNEKLEEENSRLQ